MLMDFMHFIFPKVVAMQLRCGGMSSNHFTTNFENLSIFGKDMDKILWITFLGHPVYYCKLSFGLLSPLDVVCVTCPNCVSHSVRGQRVNWAVSNKVHPSTGLL